MDNVYKVVDLVSNFSASCLRHGLCDEKTFPQDFILIIKDMEEYVRLPFFARRSYGYSFFLGQRVYKSGQSSIEMCQ